MAIRRPTQVRSLRMENLVRNRKPLVSGPANLEDLNKGNRKGTITATVTSKVAIKVTTPISSMPERPRTLVLEYLRDQKNKPDRKLLDKLGWDQEDVQKFVRRWDEMKRKAGNDGVQPGTGQKELDDVLRGMGLQAPQKQLRTASDRKDAQRNDRNTGRRTRVPANQRDWFHAFQKAMQGE